VRFTVWPPDIVATRNSVDDASNVEALLAAALIQRRPQARHKRGHPSMGGTRDVEALGRQGSPKKMPRLDMGLPGHLWHRMVGFDRQRSVTRLY